MFTTSKQVSFSAKAYVVKIYAFQIIAFIYSSPTSLFIYDLTKKNIAQGHGLTSNARLIFMTQPST